jgi:hypothetical protein
MIPPISRRAAPLPEPPRPKTKTPAAFPLLEQRATPLSSTAASNPASQAPPLLARVLGQIDGQRAEIDRIIDQATRGKTFSPQDLLLMQTKVYAYSQNMEVISHLLDRTVSMVKTTLNTQV